MTALEIRQGSATDSAPNADPADSTTDADPADSTTDADPADSTPITVPDATPLYDWSCLGAPSPRKALGPLTYENTLHNITGSKVITDATLELCDSTDDTCANPVLSTAAVGDGHIQFTVDGSFNGYLLLDSPSMLPSIIELSRPIGEMRVLPDFRLLDSFTLDLFAANMNATVDPALGHVLYWVEDCQGKRAAGVSVAPLGGLPTSSRQYYVVDQRLPSDTLTQTDASGGGGFINLPTTYMTFEARLAGGGAHISTFAGRVRAGHVTFTVIEPD